MAVIQSGNYSIIKFLDTDSDYPQNLMVSSGPMYHLSTEFCEICLVFA